MSVNYFALCEDLQANALKRDQNDKLITFIDVQKDFFVFQSTYMLT